ncbi:hypothetical protein LCGC14_0963360 [marine sediment metagenome]|uniref:Uncharacterized protein n=1 Tax=marine sediment metagenome TaxID=412755 RepID=A0A0F9NZV2_9ZZZZ
MPTKNGNGKGNGNETTAEFQQRTFPQRVVNVKRKTAKVLDPLTRSSEADKAKARKAQAAANRVSARMSGKPPERSAATKPGSPGSTPETRQRAFERGTGTDKIRNPLEKIGEMAKKGNGK